MRNWLEQTLPQRIEHLRAVLKFVLTLPESKCYLNSVAKVGTAQDYLLEEQAEHACGTKFCLIGHIAHDDVLGPLWDIDLAAVKSETVRHHLGTNIPEIHFIMVRPEITDALNERSENRYFDGYHDLDRVVNASGSSSNWLDIGDVLAGDYVLSEFLFDLRREAGMMSERTEMIFRLLMAISYLETAADILKAHQMISNGLRTRALSPSFPDMTQTLNTLMGQYCQMIDVEGGVTERAFDQWIDHNRLSMVERAKDLNKQFEVN